MGLPRFRGRGMGVAKGFVKPAGLGHPMKHSLGPRGIWPRFPLPPAGMSLPPPVLRLPATRHPGFVPPSLHPAHAGGPRSWGFVPSPLYPAQAGGPRPPGFVPSPMHPTQSGESRPPAFVLPPMYPAQAGGPRPPGFVPPPLLPAQAGGPRPPGFVPPSLHPVQAGRPRPPGFVPRPMHPAQAGRPRPPGFVPPPMHPAQAGEPQPPKFFPMFPPPHFPQPPFMPSLPPVPSPFNDMLGRGVAYNSGGRGKIKNKKQNQNAGNVMAGVHYCETCDKDLKDAEKLAQHLAVHTVCGHGGCTFQAHPKVIAKHVHMQHWTGLYEKICLVNNPEDVAKWIQERKNRYPTKANIERREAEKKEQVDRGERLGHEPQSFDTFTRGRNRWRGGRGMQNRMRGQHWKFKPQADENSNETAKEGCDAEAVEQDKLKRGHWRMLRGRGMRSRMRGHHWKFRPKMENNCIDTEMEGSNAQVAEQGKFGGVHRFSFRGRGMRSRMRGHHWKFRPKMENNCIDTEMEGSNAQVAEQGKFGGVHRFSFRGRGVWNRMHGHYRKKRPAADGDGEADNHSGEEMEAWNAQVAEEEKLLRRGRLITFPGTGAFPDTCEDKTPAPNIQEGGEFSDTEWEGSSRLSHEKPLVASRVLMSLIGSYASDQSDNEGNGESAESGAPPVPLTARNSCNGATSESLYPEDAAVQNDSDGAPEEVPIVFKEHTGEPSALSTALPIALPPATDRNWGEAHHPSKKRRHRARPARLKGVENTTEMACDNTSQRPVAKRPWYPQRCRPTLLDKLLREEIRHERNVILQCINHIMKHSFFSGHSASKAVKSAMHSPCDNRVKIIVKCIGHIVNCGLLDKDDSVNTGNSLIECS